MRKHVAITIMSLSLTLIACSSGPGPYDRGYAEGHEEGYNKGLEEALNYVYENYSMDEVYDPEDMLDYITRTYDISDIYTDKELIDYLQGSGYVVISADDYSKATEVDSKTEIYYIGNTNTKVFHRPSCESVSRMKDKNKKRTTKEELIEDGYEPCDICKP